MNAATEVHAGYRPAQETALRTVAGGAILESIGAIATLGLAIVGLAGVFSPTMAAIATIIFGAALWMEGGVFATRYSEGALEWGESLSVDFLGGVAGIVLGILALLGLAAVTLLSVAIMAFGATLMFRRTEGISAGYQSAFGLGTFVLGLLAVIGLSSLPLVLVALLCLGASALFTGAAMGARTAIAMRK
jgi:hypothetical protein